MRWYIAEDVFGIRDALIEAGETVVSLEKNERQNQGELEETGDFKLKIMIRDAPQFDVILLGNISDSIGYARSAVLPWAGGVRGRCVVGVSTDDPDAMWRLKNAMRGCVVGLSQCQVYVTNDESSAVEASTYRKSVLWDGDVSKLIEAASDTCNHRFDKRRYF